MFGTKATEPSCKNDRNGRVKALVEAPTRLKTQMSKTETKSPAPAPGFSLADIAKIAELDKAFTKKPRNLVVAQSAQVKLKLQKKQNALFVFLKKPKSQPTTPLHSVLFAASPPELRAVTEIYEGELQYCHKSRPLEVLRLPMEVMQDPANINWCVDVIKQSSESKTQPMPDMTRELVVLYANSIRSETTAVKTTSPQGDEITTYHTTLNKPDGTKEEAVSVSIKSAASTLPN